MMQSTLTQLWSFSGSEKIHNLNLKTGALVSRKSDRLQLGKLFVLYICILVTNQVSMIGSRWYTSSVKKNIIYSLYIFHL